MAQHPARQPADRLQRRAGRLRADHADLRRLARRPLPRDPDRQRGHRHRPGGTRQAEPRPPGGAGRAEGHGRARRQASRGRRPGRRAGRPRPGGRGRPGGGRRPGGGQRGPRGGRVHPHRGERAGDARARRGAAGRLLRGRGLGVLRGRGGRARHLRGAAHRRGARVPPPALAVRAGAGPADPRPHRRHGAARGAAAVVADRAGQSLPRVGRDGRRRRDHDRPGGARPAHRDHLCGRDAADDAAGRAQPAAERGRVAGVGRHRLHRQDRHAHRGPPAGGRPDPRRRRRGRAVGPPRPLRGELAEPQLHARGHRRGLPGNGGARARGRAVLLAAALERPVDGRALVRAGRARALRPRGPPRGARRRGGAAGAARAGLHRGRRAARRGPPRLAAPCRAAAAGPRRPGRGAAPGRARDRGLPAGAGGRDQGDLGRRAGDRRGHRRRRGHPAARRAG